MPKVTNGNANSPTLMLAEKLGNAILGQPLLPREPLDVWQHENYETCQR